MRYGSLESVCCTPLKFKYVLLAVFSAALISFSSGGHALYLEQFQPKVNERFYTGADKAFIGEGYNWSGVNNGPRWATMISPSYFLSAAHAAPAAGSQLNFYPGNDLSAAPETHFVDSFSFQTSLNGSPSDLWLGRLTTPVSSAITTYPILKLPSEADYIGLSMYVYGHGTNYGTGNIVGLNKISVVDTLYYNTREAEYFFDGNSGASTAALIGGDSGAPSFVAFNGELALVGIHFWSCGTNPGDCQGDSFVPFYIDQISAAMGSEQLRVVGAVPLPESAGMFVLGILLLASAAYRRKTTILKLAKPN